MEKFRDTCGLCCALVMVTLLYPLIVPVTGKCGDVMPSTPNTRFLFLVFGLTGLTYTLLTIRRRLLAETE